MIGIVRYDSRPSARANHLSMRVDFRRALIEANSSDYEMNGTLLADPT
jgi:hypothetical protein